MQLYENRRSHSRGWGRFIVLFFLIAAIAGLVYVFFKFDIRGQAPAISLKENKSGESVDVTQTIHFSRTPDLSLVVEVPEGGICQIDFVLKQNNNQIKLIENKTPRNKDPNKIFKIEGHDLIAAGFQEGLVSGMVTASNCALISKKTSLNVSGDIDLTPPRLALTSTQHYINQGGADVAVYTVSPEAVWSGIRIGNYQFKGYPKPGAGAQSGEHFVFFVYSYEFPAGQTIELIAYDQAGNEAKTTLTPARFFPKEFRRRELPVDDNFINTKVADIIAGTPELKNTGDPIKNYLMVNRDLRKKNAHDLIDFSKKSEPVFFWKDAFISLAAAVEANFADYRSYMYNGEKVDEQVHLGFDLANFEHNPVTAANSGKVLFAGYLGIYGNTILIDHGYGLITLYGHLSSMDVKAGDRVERSGKIGNSGATGLAGGDHLHFSLLIQGVQANPVEFWDQHWIDDHVYLRLGKENFGK